MSTTETSAKVTVLSLAAFEGRNEIVKILLESGADVNKETDDGYTPLYVASEKGELGVVKCLVEEGKAEVDKAKNNGWSPLGVAKQFKNEEKVMYLRGKGAKE